MIRQDGSRGRRQRSMVLGLVSEIPTRRQAQTLLDQRLRPLNHGEHRPQSATAFKDLALREWMSLNFPTYKLTTQRGYRLVLHRHVLPYFGTWPLCDVTKRDVQQFVGEKFQQRLAWQTVRNMWIVASAILEAAVQYSYLTENPARGVKFPPRPPSREPEVLRVEAFTALLGHLPEPVATMVTLAGADWPAYRGTSLPCGGTSSTCRLEHSTSGNRSSKVSSRLRKARRAPGPFRWDRWYARY